MLLILTPLWNDNPFQTQNFSIIPQKPFPRKPGIIAPSVTTPNFTNIKNLSQSVKKLPSFSGKRF